MKTTVSQILKVKGRDVWSIPPQASVLQALQRMAEKEVGALVVIEEGRAVGIFSERDYARRVALEGLSSRDTTVRDRMTESVLYVTPENTVEECMALMTDKRVRHLPVFENKELIGIISIGDVVNKVISEQEFTIRELERYIEGKDYST
jgi:CBS domain-containing protein